MPMTSKRSIFALCALVLFLVTARPTGAGASGFQVPFTDENTTGTLTLCNRNEQPITSGSLTTVPFIWSAVSSTAAPSGYTRAYLSVYQPIQHEDPGDWTGYQLTDQAIFNHSNHPIAQATNADVPLYYADHSIPPYWDGLYELRMYFSSPNQVPENSSYPSAVIRVSGDTWTLVSGGGGSCNVGKAVSVESLLLPKSEIDTPQTLVVGPKHAASPATSPDTTSGQTHPQGGAATSVASSSSTTSDSAATKLAAGGSAGKGSGGGASAGLIAAVVLIVLVVAGGVTTVLLRRRRRLSV